MSEQPQHRDTGVALPDVIRSYQTAHDNHETDAALATFTADATVTDEGRTHVGTDEIRAWLERTATEYRYARTLLDVEPLGAGSWLVANHLEGNFPGGTVDLRYRFVLAGERISELVIAP